MRATLAGSAASSRISCLAGEPLGTEQNPQPRVHTLPRIMNVAAPRAKQILSNPPEQPTLEELRKRYGTNDDDELILRALVPQADIDKMRAAGPVQRDYPLLSTPELEQVASLMRLVKSRSLQIRSAQMSLSLSRQEGN